MAYHTCRVSGFEMLHGKRQILLVLFGLPALRRGAPEVKLDFIAKAKNVVNARSSYISMEGVLKCRP